MKRSIFRFIKGVGITYFVLIGMTFAASLIADFAFKSGEFAIEADVLGIRLGE